MMWEQLGLVSIRQKYKSGQNQQQQRSTPIDSKATLMILTKLLKNKRRNIKEKIDLDQEARKRKNIKKKKHNDAKDQKVKIDIKKKTNKSLDLDHDQDKMMIRREKKRKKRSINIDKIDIE